MKLWNWIVILVGLFVIALLSLTTLSASVATQRDTAAETMRLRARIAELEQPKVSIELPVGYKAYEAIVVVVDIDHNTATEGMKAQETVRTWAHQVGKDVLVIGCLPVEADVSTCPSVPFIVHGGVALDDKRTMR